MNKGFEILEWDTIFFGIKVARLNDFIGPNELDGIVEDLKASDVKVAYCFVEPNNVRMNEALSLKCALLADEKVTYTIDTSQVKPVCSDAIVEYEGVEANNELVSISQQSGEFSRFRVDKNFGPEACDRLYRQWIQNAVSKKFDSILYVYKDADQILGLVSLKNLNTSGSISLIGVDSRARGKSIGTELVKKAIWHYQDRGVFTLDVVTQKANKLACNFYEKNGFTISNIKNIYHLWL